MLDLPSAISTYFALDDNADEAALANCFTSDAVVHDEAREHRGIAAIEVWRRETMARTPFVARPLSLSERDGAYVVSAEVSGDFPGSPVTLDHRFQFRDERIAALDIR